MFSHVTVGVSDLDRAGRFYDAVLLPLDLQRRPVTPDGGPASACWVGKDHTLPRFYAYIPFDGRPANAGNGSWSRSWLLLRRPFRLPTPRVLPQVDQTKARRVLAPTTAMAISALISATPTATRCISSTAATFGTDHPAGVAKLGRSGRIV